MYKFDKKYMLEQLTISGFQNFLSFKSTMPPITMAVKCVWWWAGKLQCHGTCQKSVLSPNFQPTVCFSHAPKSTRNSPAPDRDNSALT